MESWQKVNQEERQISPHSSTGWRKNDAGMRYMGSVGEDGDAVAEFCKEWKRKVIAGTREGAPRRVMQRLKNGPPALL